MKRLKIMCFMFVLFVAIFHLNAQDVKHDNVFAWCIVPFDKLERTPEQRITMLNEIGVKSYAYDWRTEHLPTFEHEIDLARESGIDINAVWMWLDKNNEIGNLTDDNKKLLEIIKRKKLNTQLWVSFPEDYFEGLSEKECIKISAELIQYLISELEATNCGIGLYNHGGWFGEPENLVKIIKEVSSEKVGIVFNFHHAHHLLANYEKMVKNIMPYLWAVNVNGMIETGPKILPLATGDKEKFMIEVLLKNGYNGPWGILGHRNDKDVKWILEENLRGFGELMQN